MHGSKIWPVIRADIRRHYLPVCRYGVCTDNTNITRSESHGALGAKDTTYHAHNTPTPLDVHRIKLQLWNNVREWATVVRAGVSQLSSPKAAELLEDNADYFTTVCHDLSDMYGVGAGQSLDCWSPGPGPIASGAHPSHNPPHDFGTSDIELHRHKLREDIRGWWGYTRSQLHAMEGITGVNDTLGKAGQCYRKVEHELWRLGEADGSGEWRRRETQRLGDVVQARLHELQNPSNCTSSKRLYLRLRNGCGFGCLIKVVAAALSIAYYTGRTLILSNKFGAIPYHHTSWGHLFLMPTTCAQPTQDIMHPWQNHTDQHLIVDVEPPTRTKWNLWYTNFGIPITPLTIPVELEPLLIRLVADPIDWWLGQLIKYCMRVRPQTRQRLERTMAAWRFGHPIVGLHVRQNQTRMHRFHLDEYMAYAQEYFDILDMRQSKPVERLIYLSTDTVENFALAHKRYPKYRFIYNDTRTGLAAMKSWRNENTLSGVLEDMYLLSRCDYLVFTMSSHFGTSTHMLRHTNHPNAGRSEVTLDYPIISNKRRVVIQNLKRKTNPQTSVKRGDVIRVFKWLDDGNIIGYSKGKDKHVLPAYKTRSIVKFAEFPDTLKL